VIEFARKRDGKRSISIAENNHDVDTDEPDSRKKLGFSFRRLVLAVLILILSRGAIELVSDGNRPAGISVVILVSIVAGWLFLRYEESHSEE